MNGRPFASSSIAESPTGQTRTHTPHSMPWNARHRRSSTPMIASFTSAHPRVGASSAPVGHAVTQGMSSHMMHARSSTSMIGVPAAMPCCDGSMRMASAGHTLPHSLQRVHAARNAGSAMAPGGRTCSTGAILSDTASTTCPIRCAKPWEKKLRRSRGESAIATKNACRAGEMTVSGCRYCRRGASPRTPRTRRSTRARSSRSPMRTATFGVLRMPTCAITDSSCRCGTPHTA